MTVFQRFLQPFVLPPVFDFWAGKMNTTWAWNRTLARVVERHPESATATTLWLKPNGHFAGFRPGQHVAVTAEVNGRRITRSYSITNIPQSNVSQANASQLNIPQSKGLIAITVREVKGGALSPYLSRRVQIGDVLELGAAFGELALPAATPCLLLAAGSGITPLMALIRQQAIVGMPTDLTLMYWARKREDFCFFHELSSLAQRFPRFKLHLILTGEKATLAHESEGRISENLFNTLQVNAQGQAVLACGSNEFVEQAKTLLQEKAQSFQAEQFTPPVIQHNTAERVKVHLNRSGQTLDVSAGESLLNALEAAGLQPEYGCRMGICNTCACGKTAGITQNLLNQEISHDSTDALRLCISRATSDIALDL